MEIIFRECRRLSLLALLTGILGTTACVGGMGLNHADQDGTQGKTDGSTDPNGSASLGTAEKNHLPIERACLDNSDTPAPRQLRRLTATELNATLQTLFADPNAPQASGIFDNDPEVYTFHNVAGALVVSGVSASQVQGVAEAAGAYAMANPAKVSPTCQTTDVACRTQFVTTFGGQAFRRPMATAEVQSYLTLMQNTTDFATGAGVVVDAMLQSPYFLYRSEIGTTGSNGIFKLTPYEVASELSYMIVGSMPDATLMQAAQNGNILNASVRAAQVARLMQDPRAHNTLDEFFLEWLGVADLPSESRTQDGNTLSATTAQDMLTETKTSIDTLLFTQNANFSAMHTLNSTFVNGELAQFYGLTGGSGGSTFAPVPLVGARDTGILNQGGVIAAASEVNMPSPVLRGRMLREHVLCQSLPAPPAGVPVVNGVAAGTTTRDTFVAHINNPTCNTCHTLMDPMAFTQSSYDTLGRPFPNKMENGQPIDTSGTINGLLSGAAPVQLTNASDMSNFIAQNDQAKACMARSWAMYGLGNVDWTQDGCTYDAVAKIAATSGYNLQATISALTQVTSFTQRSQDK